MSIPKSNEVNSQARWAQRIAFLAQQGVNPSDIAQQNSHKDKNASDVVEATKEMCKSFPKAQ